MRWSEAFIPTLRDAPADAEAISHVLLVRGGFIRQVAAGSYTILPLGQRVRLKVAGIIREEMNAIGGQEMLPPTLHPAEIWRKSGRYELMGDNLYKLEDRRGADLVLGMTEEELFALTALELSSYRDLPQIWYQIHTKFRDEPRPKAGLLRVREFTMKDAYTLDIDRAGLDGLRDAGIVTDSGDVATELPGFDEETARLWVEAQFACTDYIEESTRALVAQSKGTIDAEAYAACLREAITDDELREAVVASLTGAWQTPEVNKLADAQARCSSGAAPER